MEAVPHQPTSVMVIRIWWELGLFRARVTSTDDVIFDNAAATVMAASPDQVLEVVRQWLTTRQAAP